MEAFQRFTQRQNGVTMKSVLDFSPLSPPQRKHMSLVYGHLGLSVGACALGAYAQVQWLQLNTIVCLLGKIGCLIGLATTSQEASLYRKVSTPKRLGMFFGFAGLLGMSIGEYLDYINSLSPTIIPTAFFGSLAIFVCFSLAAIFAESRSLLYLGSMLSSIIFYIFLTNLINLFFRSHIVNDFVVYLGLAVYIGFILYDTQITIEDFNNGNCDYLSHAVSLFVDAVGIFLRIVQIMTENERKKKRNDRD